MSPVYYVNMKQKKVNINNSNKNNCADNALVKCLFHYNCNVMSCSHMYVTVDPASKPDAPAL